MQINAPLGARSAGHVRKGLDYLDHPPPRDLIQVFWGVGGRGEFTCNGRSFVFEKDQVTASLPHWDISWRSLSDPWEVRWMTLIGPHALKTFLAFSIHHDPHTVGPCPAGLFMELEKRIQDPTPSGELEASSIAYAILCKAGASRTCRDAANPVIDECIKLIRAHHSDRQLNVAWLAAKLKKDRSTLSRLFKTETGIAPVEYIISLRIQNALSLLRTTKMSARQIAEDCGFAEPGYFNRVFKQAMGMSPGRFRQGIR